MWHIYIWLSWWLRWQGGCLQCGRPGFYPWVGEIPWRRKWQPTLVLLPRKSHGWRSLVQATARGVAKSRTQLSDFTFTFQIGKTLCQGYIMSPWLFNLYAEHILRHAGLDEAQAGIKIAGRNINDHKYADDTTLMAESKEKLKSLLMNCETGEWKAQYSEN